VSGVCADEDLAIGLPQNEHTAATVDLAVQHLRDVFASAERFRPLSLEELRGDGGRIIEQSEVAMKSSSSSRLQESKSSRVPVPEFDKSDSNRNIGPALPSVAQLAQAKTLTEVGTYPNFDGDPFIHRITAEIYRYPHDWC
jgi:hypothetical protein